MNTSTRLGAAALLLASATAMAAVPHLAPQGRIWPVQAGFDFDQGPKKAAKTRQSVSGIACSPNAQQQRVCLLAFDEGVQARWATLHNGVLQADPSPLALRDGTGELDAEGAATDGRFFYVTGSHSAKRKSGESNPHSRHVLRFQRDPASGRALRTPDGALQGYADTGRLWAVMQAQPALQAHAQENAALGKDGGINIEGLAVRDGRLFFGLRSMGAVLAVDAAALFTPADPVQATVSLLALGAGRGIRDMQAVGQGFLLLAGPDDAAASQPLGWAVAWWDGHSRQPQLLATLDLSGVQRTACDKETKPEALAVLQETASHYRVLVLSDGMCDGGPLEFNIPR